MRVINGKWSINAYGDPMTTTEHGNEFMDKLIRIKSYSDGRRLTSNKIKILFSILDSSENMDGLLGRILQMNKSELKNIIKTI